MFTTSDNEILTIQGDGILGDNLPELCTPRIVE